MVPIDEKRITSVAQRKLTLKESPVRARDPDELSLNTWAKRASPANKTQLRLYKAGVKKMKEKKQREKEAEKNEDDVSLNTQAKCASQPNSAQLCLYCNLKKRK